MTRQRLGTVLARLGLPADTQLERGSTLWHKQMTPAIEQHAAWAMQQIALTARIETLQMEIVAATLHGHSLAVATMFRGMNNRATRQQIFSAVLRESMPGDAALLLDIWKSRVQPVMAQRDMFAHWIWARLRSQPYLLVLVDPYAQLGRDVQTLVEGRRLRRGQMMLLPEVGGRDAWVFTAKDLEQCVSTAHMALQTADLILALVSTRGARGKRQAARLRGMLRRVLRIWRGPALKSRQGGSSRRRRRG